MKSIKDKYQNKSALLISGGPSALGVLPKLKYINRDKFTIFLESKALTPYFASCATEPDFYLLPHPEKAKDNSLQNLVYQSLKVNIPIKPFVKKEFHSQLNEILIKKDDYFETWNPKKGVHKKIKHKKNLFFKDSPMDLIRDLPNIKILTIRDSFEREFPDIKLSNKFHYFKFNQEPIDKSYLNYINPTEKNDEVYINANSFTNAAAISTFPILKYLGFSDVYFLGFDMNSLGTLEYNGLKTFKSQFHYLLFMILIRKAIRHGANIKLNFPFHLRTKQEFTDLEEFIDKTHFKLFRIEGDSKKIGKVQSMNKVTIEELFT